MRLATTSPKAIAVVALMTLVSACESASQGQTVLLRYGDRAPEPQTLEESILHNGIFVGEMTPLDSLGGQCRGTLSFRGQRLTVFVKHAYYLGEIQQREGIPFHSDNRNADAAYQINRYLRLVDTPEHVLRDDVPTCNGVEGVSSAGVQRFSLGSQATTKASVAELMSQPDLLDEIESMAVFDVVIGNTDRHDRNWRYRINPGSGKRQLLAIDHSLAFPIEDYVRGNYAMIDRYLASSRSGALSPAVLDKLERFVLQRADVDAVLRLNLNPRAIEKIWSRVDRLLETGRVFSLQPPSAKRQTRHSDATPKRRAREHG